MINRGSTHRRKLLRIYLNDHLTAAAGAIELARRSLRNNRGTPLGAFLEELLTEITEDRAALEKLMAALEFQPDRIKLAAAVIAEKVGRLKLNGQIFRYSDLSRLIEIDGLYGVVDLKLHLWLALRLVASRDPRFAVIDLDRLVERASSQLTRLERHRLDAAERAFA